jgi:S-adenosylmethionine synthetase
MEPVIDPAQTLALIEATHEFVDHYGVGKMNHNPEIEKNIDWPKFRADVEAMLKRYGKEYMIKAALAEASRGANHMPGDPAIRARLWDSIRSKMKKYARVDKERRGLAASDLSQEELELIKAAGWCPETTDQGITIFWAPEKSLKAMGLEALT